MRKPKIAVVGSSNTDMVVKSRRIPTPGETVVGGEFLVAAGGKGANQAVAAARLGAEVQFISRVGADAFGDQAIAGYRRDGINTDLIARDPDNATGVALILIDGAGENAISVASGANHAMSLEDIDRAATAIRGADVLVMQLELPLSIVARAAEIAAQAGVPVILDPAPAPEEPLPAALLRNITCIKPNVAEVEGLTGIHVADESAAREAASALLGMGPSCAIITMGADGALLADESGVVLVPAHAGLRHSIQPRPATRSAAHWPLDGEPVCSGPKLYGWLRAQAHLPRPVWALNLRCLRDPNSKRSVSRPGPNGSWARPPI